MSIGKKFEFLVESMGGRRLAALISIAVGISILILKFWAYNLTGSQAVFSDAVESIVNVITAIALLITIIYSAKPADDDHPYGHGKLEYFTAAFEGGLITFAGVIIVIEAIHSFVQGRPIGNIDEGQIIIVFASLINLGLGLFLVRSGKRQGSIALVASGTHLISDFWTSVAVLAALALVKWTGLQWIDPLLALVAAAYLVWNGLRIIFRSTNELMDAGDDNILVEILEIFLKNLKPGIIRIHHTRVIRSGPYHHIDAHVVVPEFWDVKEAHQQTDAFENQFFGQYSKEGEIHFHVDPCRRAYCRVCDYPKCPVRIEEFQERIPLTLEELKSPLEPEDFR